MNPLPPRPLLLDSLPSELMAARLGDFHVQQAEFNLLAIQASHWMLDVICDPAGGEHV